MAGSRFQAMIGKGATDPVLAEAPDNPENRRISVILITEPAAVPLDHSLN